MPGNDTGLNALLNSAELAIKCNVKALHVLGSLLVSKLEPRPCNHMRLMGAYHWNFLLHIEALCIAAKGAAATLPSCARFANDAWSLKTQARLQDGTLDEIGLMVTPKLKQKACALFSRLCSPEDVAGARTTPMALMKEATRLPEASRISASGAQLCRRPCKPSMGWG